MRAPRRALVSALSVSLLTVALSACGSDPESTSADASPTATPSADEPTAGPEDDATAKADPDAAPETDGTETGADDGADDGAEAGSWDTAPGAGPEVAPFLDRLQAGLGERGSVHVAMRMTGPAAMTAEGDTTYGPDGSSLFMTMTMPQAAGQQMTMLVAEGAVYLSMEGVTPPGTFFEVPEGSALLQGFDAGGMTPKESFAAFEAGLTGVEEVGTTRIDGRPADHLRLTLDAKRAMRAQGQQMAPGVPDELVYDLWLDSEDRMRRIRYEVAGVSVVMDMTDWGRVEEITPPRPQDLVEPPKGF
jgi:hypothetical protein